MRKSVYRYLLQSHTAFLSLAAVASASIAPQDFNKECDQFVSAYEPREKVLLDTQYYSGQSLITVLGVDKLWLSRDLDRQGSALEQKVSE